MEEFEHKLNNKTPPSMSEDTSSVVGNYLEKRNLKDEVVEVPLYQGVRIDNGPAEKNKILITANLNGCTATLIWTELADHTRSAQLVHFPPFMIERHLQKIAELVTETDKKAPQKHALVYLSSKRKENESQIIESIKSVFGADVSITSRYYENATSTESGIMGIELRSRGEGNVIYHIGKDAIAFT